MIINGCSVILLHPFFIGNFFLEKQFLDFKMMNFILLENFEVAGKKESNKKLKIKIILNLLNHGPDN